MSMRQTLAAAAASALILHLAGCEQPASGAMGRKSGAPAALAEESAGPALTSAGAGSATLAPSASTAARAPASAASPDLVLREWGTAIERRDWAAVRRLWGHDGADSGLSAQAFAARWDGLRHPRVAIGEGEQEGAAGSSYYTAPVTITDGERTIGGELTIRRVNDIDGATAEQLRWHADATSRAPWTTLR